MTIPERLQALAQEMRELSVDMLLCEYRNHQKFRAHAKELAGAASIAESWIGEIEKLN